MEPGCGSSTVFFPQDVIATIPTTAAKAMILSAFIIENYNSKLNKYKKWELKYQ